MQSSHRRHSLKQVGILWVAVCDATPERTEDGCQSDSIAAETGDTPPDRFGSILIADSDPQHAFYLECLLRRLAPNYEVCVVPSGEEAIDFLTVSVLRADMPTAVLLGDSLAGHPSREILAWARGHAAFDTVAFLLFGRDGGSPNARLTENDVVDQQSLVAALRQFVQRHCSSE